MQMPKPGKVHAKLAAFVGEGAGDETIHPTAWDPAGGPAKGTTKRRADCAGENIHAAFKLAARFL